MMSLAFHYGFFTFQLTIADVLMGLLGRLSLAICAQHKMNVGQIMASYDLIINIIILFSPQGGIQ